MTRIIVWVAKGGKKTLQFLKHGFLNRIQRYNLLLACRAKFRPEFLSKCQSVCSHLHSWTPSTLKSLGSHLKIPRSTSLSTVHCDLQGRRGRGLKSEYGHNSPEVQSQLLPRPGRAQCYEGKSFLLKFNSKRLSWSNLELEKGALFWRWVTPLDLQHHLQSLPRSTWNKATKALIRRFNAGQGCLVHKDSRSRRL